MRPLTKRAEPICLTTESKKWTNEFAVAISIGAPLPTRWRHRQIVDGLVAETMGKCAYCEGYIPDVAYPHIDHILPKSVRPDLVVEWTNLTLACPACNTSKGDYFDAEVPLVNPYIDNPDDHFTFAGPMLAPMIGDVRARTTVRRLKLQRAALVLSRMKRIEDLHLLVDLWDQEQEPRRSAFALEIRDRIKGDQEFSTFLKHYAMSLGFPF